MELVKPRRTRWDYERVKEEAAKPAKERKEIILTSVWNKRKPRHYDIPEKKLQVLKDQYQKTGILPNPMQRKGAFYGFVQALIELGTDHVHEYRIVKKKMEEVMTRTHVKHSRQSCWESFLKRKSRNRLCGRDVDGRIMGNAILLQRLRGVHVYGYKLAQLDACIDILVGERLGRIILPAYRLRTKCGGYNQVKPTNELTQKQRGIIIESGETSERGTKT
jgi:hypothetical protein